MHFPGCRRRAALPRPLGRRTTENKGKVIGDAKHGALPSLALPSGMFHRPVLPPRPSNWPFEASETSKSSASPAMTKCSRLCDDQALVEELPVPPPHYSTNSFLITFAADLRHHSLLSFSPIGPNNSPVLTIQSNGTIPCPSRLLARLNCADLQALGDILDRVETRWRVGVQGLAVSARAA